MSSPVTRQVIITAFEECGFTPEQIAADQELEVAAVKAVLLQGSSVYRKAVKNVNKEIEKINNIVENSNNKNESSQEESLSELDSKLEERHRKRALQEIVSEDEIEEIVMSYKNLALTTPVDAVRERGLKFLIQEFKGRNDVGMGAMNSKKEQQHIVNNFIKKQNFNIFLLNKALKENRIKKNEETAEGEPILEMEEVSSNG